jgi:peptidoglycan L-alanyl-D-glutamate endopeptidase CwlK
MPEFSRVSLARLDTCHHDLQLIASEVVRLFDCSVLEGHRDEDRQTMLFQKGLSQVEWPDGKHNPTPSMAMDIAPYPINWDDEGRFYFFAGYLSCVAASLLEAGKITHLVRWGGDWDRDRHMDDQDFNDLCHFELISLENRDTD